MRGPIGLRVSYFVSLRHRLSCLQITECINIAGKVKDMNGNIYHTSEASKVICINFTDIPFYVLMHS